MLRSSQDSSLSSGSFPSPKRPATISHAHRPPTPPETSIIASNLAKQGFRAPTQGVADRPSWGSSTIATPSPNKRKRLFDPNDGSSNESPKKEDKVDPRVYHTCRLAQHKLKVADRRRRFAEKRYRSVEKDLANLHIDDGECPPGSLAPPCTPVPPAPVVAAIMPLHHLRQAFFEKHGGLTLETVEKWETWCLEADMKVLKCVLQTEAVAGDIVGHDDKMGFLGTAAFAGYLKMWLVTRGTWDVLKAQCIWAWLHLDKDTPYLIGTNIATNGPGLANPDWEITAPFDADKQPALFVRHLRAALESTFRRLAKRALASGATECCAEQKDPNSKTDCAHFWQHMTQMMAERDQDVSRHQQCLSEMEAETKTLLETLKYEKEEQQNLRAKAALFDEATRAVSMIPYNFNDTVAATSCIESFRTWMFEKKKQVDEPHRAQGSPDEGWEYWKGVGVPDCAELPGSSDAATVGSTLPRLSVRPNRCGMKPPSGLALGHGELPRLSWGA